MQPIPLVFKPRGRNPISLTGVSPCLALDWLISGVGNMFLFELSPSHKTLNAGSADSWGMSIDSYLVRDV